MKRLIYYVVVFFSAVTFVSCGGETNSDSPTSTGSSSDSGTLEFIIRPVGDQMKYETESISVSAGTEVTLIMENIATLPTMVHNIVVLKTDSDEDVNRVGMAAISAENYLPEDEAIFTATPIAQPGETVRVTFTTPTEPGTYRYICTYPGHYALMQGVMIVT